MISPGNLVHRTYFKMLNEQHPKTIKRGVCGRTRLFFGNFSLFIHLLYPIMTTIEKELFVTQLYYF